MFAIVAIILLASPKGPKPPEPPYVSKRPDTCSGICSTFACMSGEAVP